MNNYHSEEIEKLKGFFSLSATKKSEHDWTFIFKSLKYGTWESNCLRIPFFPQDSLGAFSKKWVGG